MRIALLAAALLASPLALADDRPPFAVVELFTSEGCSSCPPADRLMKQVHDAVSANGQRVYCLAYHVDYWDRLGWRDRFSDPAHSRRQSLYAHARGSDRVYTPQVIVNGRDAFVGSNRAKTQHAIAEALMQAATSSVGITLKIDDDHLTVDYAVADAPPEAVLNVALVESNLSTDVRRGENAGRTLHHAPVVRVFQTIDLPGDDAEGRTTLTLPPDTRPEHTAVIAFVQSTDTLHIHGADRAALPAE